MDGDHRPQLLGPFAGRDRLHGLVQQRLQGVPGPLKPQLLNRIGPVVGEILVCGLAPGGRIGDAVADVVGHLKSLAQAFAEPPPCRAFCSGRKRARDRGRGEQGPRLGTMIVRQRDARLTLPSLARADSGRSANGLAHNAYQGREAIGHLSRVPAERLERQNDQRIAGQDRERLTISLVQGGLASAHIRVVKTGQIVVNQRGAMEQLDRGGRRVGEFGRPIATGLRHCQGQPRPYPSPPWKNGVSQALGQLGRTGGPARLGDRVLQRVFDPLAQIHWSFSGIVVKWPLHQFVTFNIDTSNRKANANPMLSRRTPRAVVIGAGIGGLAAALELAARDVEVVVVERASSPGGKMRELKVDGRPIDSGPTVLTMRWVFEQLFDSVGESFADQVKLQRAEILARHAWRGGATLDLFEDVARSADAIGDFAGAKEAAQFRAFCDRARATYRTLETSFIKAQQPSVVSLTRSAGLKGLGDLWRISPFTTLWSALGGYFRDPKLRQLFARYSTYCGSSPFDAPATLMLVADVEQEGVWLVDGGMHQLAVALQSCAERRGAEFRFGCEVSEILVERGSACGVTLDTGERLAADIVLVNADVSAVSAGRFGPGVAAAVAPTAPASRSLSAITFSMLARTHGFPLTRHNVFFSDDYRREFDEIFGARQVPTTPTIYVCAQDRGAAACQSEESGSAPERLFCLINAPAVGDMHSLQREEIERCRDQILDLSHRVGLCLEPTAAAITTPEDFNRLYPGTGGALYGQASHGWNASFTRPTARSKIPGLYLAGGSTHPGPGVPMAALSGRLAAASILQDLTSARPSLGAAISGGMSMA